LSAKKEEGVRKLQREKTLKIAASTLLVLSLAVSTIFIAIPIFADPEITPWDFPRLDELWMVRKYPSAVSLEAAKACDIDVFIGAIDPEHVTELEALGWSTSMTELGGFHMCYHGFNCRDYAPVTAGVFFYMFGRTPGFSLYPLNISSFRLAMQYVVGFEEKEEWCWSIYGYAKWPQMFYVPFANEYWVNPFLEVYHTDWEMAVDVLVENGFYYDVGADGRLNSYTVASTDDIWYCPNGMKLIGGPDSASPGSDREATGEDWVGDPIYGIFVACPGDGLAPPSHEISRLHMRKWNRFFMGVASDGSADSSNTALFIDLPDDTYGYIYFSSFYNRDHDIFMLCWGLGRNPDYLYDLFHPDVDYPGWGNSPGLDHAGCNRVMYALKYWKVIDWDIVDKNLGEVPEKVIAEGTEYVVEDADNITDVIIERCHKTGVYDEELTSPDDYTISGSTLTIEQTITLYPGDALEVLYDPGSHHRMLTTMAEMRDLVWIIQWKFYYLNPYNPIYSRNYINLFKPGLTCWVESEGYGSADSGQNMPWTFGSIHWTGIPVGGSMKWHVAGRLESLNPFLASWVYEAMIINRLFDSGYVVNPETHADMPWVACDWKLVEWISEDPYVPNGMKIKIWLRNDVTWHDGSPVTAKDVKWNFDFINSTQAPELAGLWIDYMGAEVVNDELVEIYVNATGMWKAYDYIGSIVQFPKIIWYPFWGDYDGAIAFEPWDVSYEEWTGCPAPIDKPGLTCYIGTGPFWMDYFDIDTGIAHLLKNQDYWVRRAGIPSGQVGQLYVKSQCTEKKDVGPVFELTSYEPLPTELPPYPGYEKPQLTNPAEPISSWWTSAPGNWAHINSWRDDDGNGELSIGDNIDLLVNWPLYDMHGIYNFNVTVYDPPGFMMVSLVKLVPGLECLSQFRVTFENLQKSPCTFEYYLTVDLHQMGEEIPCTGSQEEPVRAGPVPIFGTWTTRGMCCPDIPPGNHHFRLYCRKDYGGGVYGPWTLQYEKKVCIPTADPEWLTGDADCDGKVSMKDIFAAILSFGAMPWETKYNPAVDTDCDGKISMKDIFAMILQFGDSYTVSSECCTYIP
jgi:hypothetical protein